MTSRKNRALASLACLLALQGCEDSVSPDTEPAGKKWIKPPNMALTHM